LSDFCSLSANFNKKPTDHRKHTHNPPLNCDLMLMASKINRSTPALDPSVSDRLAHTPTDPEHHAALLQHDGSPAAGGLLRPRRFFIIFLGKDV
jgi:hypothetical protein